MTIAWISFRLDLMVTLVCGLTPFVLAASKVQGWKIVSDGDVVLYGTILSNIFLIGNQMSYFVFTFSEVAKDISAVQRILEYTEVKDQEDAWMKPGVPKQWPSEGSISVKDVSVRFRPGLPLVLKQLNNEIPSKSKVGIIGRTGSGKSTLMLVLTRLLEVEEGTIELDKLDTKNLGLHSVRRNISVIPQDPFLLQGTL